MYCCTNDKRADGFRHGSPIIYHKHYGQPMFARDSRIIAILQIILLYFANVPAIYDDVPARLTGQVRYVYTSCKRIWNRHIINVPTYIIIICILIEVNNIILSCRVNQDIFSRTRVRPTFGRFIGRTFFISRVPLLYISHIIILYRQRTVFVLHYSTWFIFKCVRAREHDRDGCLVIDMPDAVYIVYNVTLLLLLYIVVVSCLLRKTRGNLTCSFRGDRNWYNSFAQTISEIGNYY